MRNLKGLLVLNLLIWLSSCAHITGRGVETDICSLVSIKDKTHFECNKPDHSDYSFEISDKKADDLVCVPSIDWTMIQIELKKD